MELNLDCVRDILLTVEKNPFGKRMNLSSLNAELPKYSQEQLWYTCIKLEEGGYLQLRMFSQLKQPLPAIKSIQDLTFSGHEFLNSIRSETTWHKTKEVAKKAGNYSLTAISEIAKSVTVSVIAGLLQSRL